VPLLNRTRQLKQTFVRLLLAVQFVLALSALIAAGIAVAFGVDPGMGCTRRRTVLSCRCQSAAQC
jgi:hypothetical protein